MLSGLSVLTFQCNIDHLASTIAAVVDHSQWAANASPIPSRIEWSLMDERLGQSSDSPPEDASGAFCEPRDGEGVPCGFQSR